MEEEWKDIKGYEGKYKISNLGRVKAIERKVRQGKGEYFIKEHELKTWIDSVGYVSVGLTVDSKTKYFRIHRLIAEAFIPNPNNLPVINHLNGNKTDYRIENLEWTNQKQNSIHAVKTGLKKVTEKQIDAARKNVLLALEKTKKKVKQYDLNGNYIKTWNSMTEIEKTLKIHYQGISKCCLGKNKTSYGYIWKYA